MRARNVRMAVTMAALYLVTLVSLDPVDALTALVLGAVLTALLAERLRLGPQGPLPPFAQRLLWSPVFVYGILEDVLAGTREVAVVVLRPARLKPGIVRVPIGDRTDRGVAMSALATTLSPGSLLLDVDWGRREMLLHVIDASDPDALRARLQRFYDRYQRRVFP